MQEWRRGFLAWRADVISRQKIKSSFYTIFVPISDHVKWLDMVAGTGLFENFGWSRKAWSFWWNDKELYKKCKTGLLTPTMWRLFETGKRKAWPMDREQIMKDNEIAAQREKERSEIKDREKVD